MHNNVHKAVRSATGDICLCKKIPVPPESKQFSFRTTESKIIPDSDVLSRTYRACSNMRGTHQLYGSRTSANRQSSWEKSLRSFNLGKEISHPPGRNSVINYFDFFLLVGNWFFGPSQLLFGMTTTLRNLDCNSNR